MTEHEQKLKEQCFIAAALGDVIGVSFEFKHSSQIKLDFIEDPKLITKEYKTYPNVPVGYISDDFSQILCVEACINNPELDFNEELIKWSSGKYWTGNKLFDIGFQTSSALIHLETRVAMGH
jgi:ADP-ribosylglycohydrolase